MKLPKATLRRIYNAIVLATVASVLLIPFGPLASPLPATPAEAAGTWATKAAMPTARNGLSLGANIDIIYAAGGWDGFHRTTVEAYDTSNNSWTAKASMFGPQTHAASGVINGVLYLAGGTDCCVEVNTFTAYNIASNSWSTKPNMPTTRQGAAGGVINGKLYVAGGIDTVFPLSIPPLATLEVFDPVANTWATKVPMPTPRWFPQGGVVNGVFYVVGGLTNSNGDPTVAVTTVEAYDPAANTWTTKTPMPTARWFHAVAVVNGILYAVGGLDSNGATLSTVVAYDPVSNTWATEPSMPTARLAFRAETVGGTLYAIGGAGAAGQLKVNEAFTPGPAAQPGPTYVVTRSDDPAPNGCNVGDCSLREAVLAANAAGASRTISFDPSTNNNPITLSIAGAGEDAAASGDLDTTGVLTISGNGATNTIIQACDASANPSCVGIDRLFDVMGTSTLTMNGVTVRNGTVFNISGGAGIRVGHVPPWEGGNGVNAVLILNDSRVLNNTAHGHGGGILHIGTVTINRSIIAGNRALGIHSGGGFMTGGGQLTITDSTISGNEGAGGGGIFNNPGSLSTAINILNSTISGNSAAFGGGLYQNQFAPYNGPLSLTNTTVSGNRAAGAGGGIVNAGSQLTLTNVTVTGNTADTDGNNDGDGGGLWTAPGGTATIKNTVVAGNFDVSSGIGAAINRDCGGAVTSQGYNLIGDGTGCSGVTNGINGDQVGTSTLPIDPKLGPLQNNGGPTNTHALLVGSPAINAGSNANAAGLTNDQRGPGFPRIVNVTVDIGAFETTLLPVPADTTAPTTSTTATGTAGANGWYTSNVTVGFSATDNPGGSGVKEIVYSVNGGTPVVTSGSTASTTLTADGTYTITYYAMDNANNSSSTATLNVKLDKTGPSANLAVTAGTLGANGWYTSNVTVSITGSDSLSGPVTCTADQLQTAETTGTVFNGSCTNDAGLTTNAAPLTVKLDKTGPSANLAVTAGTLGNNGWYTSDVTVSTSGSDSISGPVTCTAAQFQTAETTGTVFNGSCTNQAGLTTNAAPLTVKLDKTGPTVSCSATPNSLWPPNHKLVDISASVTVSGGTSGSAGFTLIAVTSNEADNGLGDGDTANDIQGWAIGTADTAGKLRAERSGTGTGRVYTLTYEGSDQAGNKTTCSTTVVVPHDKGN